jgi:hypothetical protein
MFNFSRHCEGLPEAIKKEVTGLLRYTTFRSQ